MKSNLDELKIKLKRKQIIDALKAKNRIKGGGVGEKASSKIRAQ